MNDNTLSETPSEPSPRKKFEKEHINELWIADFMYGPLFPDEKGKKRRTYLVAIIDDHSRFIVGHHWSFHENTAALKMALKNAIMLGGRTDALYTDNGSPFITHHLNLICARLSIALIHSRPLDPPGRG
ncbi:MAG: DDE-type integrase/transposase/recombinase [Candidatus Xenobiia bacterium LiM19]